jgi:hypothetical protein
VKYSDIVAHFGSLTKAARALGLPISTVFAWGRRGRVPLGMQYMIQVKTRTKLRAEETHAAVPKAEEPND